MRIKQMGMRAVACAAAAAFAVGIGSYAVLANEEEVNSGIDIRLPIAVPTGETGIGMGVMIVENLGAEEDVLLGVSAPNGIQVEIHLTGDEDGDGVVQMNELDELNIAGGETAIMSPDGAHLMMFNIDEETEFGDFIDLTLSFEKAGNIDIQALVLDELPPAEFALAAYLNVHPEEVFQGIEEAEMEMDAEMYGGMHGYEPEVIYVPVPVYIPVPAMPGGMGMGMGMGYGMGYGMGHGMGMGMGHDMGHGMGMGMGHDMGHDHDEMGYGHGMGYGGMYEPYHH